MKRVSRASSTLTTQHNFFQEYNLYVTCAAVTTNTFELKLYKYFDSSIIEDELLFKQLYIMIKVEDAVSSFYQKYIEPYVLEYDYYY